MLKKKVRKPIKRAPQGKKLAPKPRKIPKGTPAWVKAIPQSTSHGSGHLQKRLWKLTSDYVRIRDWYKYPYCVATKRPIGNWRDGQAGHLINYTTCRGMFKFDTDNIFLQSESSNKWGGYEEWKEFEAEIISRGIDIEKLRAKNRDTSLKFSTAETIERMRYLLEEIGKLPEQPEYYERAISLLENLR